MNILLHVCNLFKNVLDYILTISPHFLFTRDGYLNCPLAAVHGLCALPLTDNFPRESTFG